MFSKIVAVFSVTCCLPVRAGEPFCPDGVNSLDDLSANGDVIVTWAQAPLNSLDGDDSMKYLNLFHTALVFRQESSSGTKWWTLEFDNAADNLMASFVPQVTSDNQLNWDTDARWCLREGIYNGRVHWKTSWQDAVVIKSADFEYLMSEWILDYNATVPGGWPQYSFFRVTDYLGDKVLDDTTCSHVHRLLTYARDDLKAKALVDLDKLTASRAYITAATLLPLSNETEHALMVSWYKGLASAVAQQASLVGKLNVVFQAVVPMQFIYDPNLQQYYKVVFALPDIVSLFTIHREPLGKLPTPPTPSPGACNVNSRCAQVMSEQCEQGTGYTCEACLGVKSSTLVAGTCPLEPVELMSAISCYCHGRCGVSDHCLTWMNKVCKPGLGCHLCLTVNMADLLLIGGCGPLTSLAAQSCFCNSHSEDATLLLDDVGDDFELEDGSFVA